MWGVTEEGILARVDNCYTWVMGVLLCFLTPPLTADVRVSVSYFPSPLETPARDLTAQFNSDTCVGADPAD